MVSRRGSPLHHFWLPAILVILFSALAAGEVDVNSLPKPTGYVEDLAHVLTPEEKSSLEAFCTRVDRELGAQFALVTIDTLGDQPIRDFALDLGRKWGVGSKGTNQGLLVLLAIKDRQNDIEVGRGLEPYVTDGFAGTTRRAMAPELRAGQYGAALTGAAHTLAAQIARGKGIPFSGAELPARPRPRRRDDSGQFGWLVILLLFFLFWLIGRGGRRGGRGGGSRVGDFATGVLVGDLLSGGRRRDDWGGGWGGGGFGGGSGGNGGFGGFGGGDFGGGGASGNW